MRSSFGCLGFFCFSCSRIKLVFFLFDFKGMKWVLFCFFVLNIYVFSVCVQAVLFSIQE